MGPTWVQFGHYALILPIWDPFAHACWGQGNYYLDGHLGKNHARCQRNYAEHCREKYIVGARGKCNQGAYVCSEQVQNSPLISISFDIHTCASKVWLVGSGLQRRALHSFFMLFRIFSIKWQQCALCGMWCTFSVFFVCVFCVQSIQHPLLVC